MKKIIILIILSIAAVFSTGCDRLQINQNQPISPTQVKKQTESCVNEQYGYKFTYPNDWKVWTRGLGEARPATCDENLASYIFTKDLFRASLHNQINIIVLTRKNQTKEFWEEINSLDDYIKKRRSVWEIKKETTVDSERLVWLEYNEQLQLAAYHNFAIYEFEIYKVDSATLDTVLSSFKFTK